MSLQKTLDSLQPYVIGIRYLEGTPVVDAVFKEGWTVPDDSKIKKAKGNDELNYYMIFSEVKGIGLDDLLNYVDKTIKVNLEREKKHELLRTKVNELKEIFKKNSLTKLQSLKFTFAEEELVPNLNDFDIDIDDELEEAAIQPTLQPIHEEVDEVEGYQAPDEEQPIAAYLDENGNPIEMTEEELELLQEEARAERNRKAIGNKKQKTNVNNQSKKVELPPKKKMEMVMSDDDYETNGECECGPNEACSNCIDSKGY
jgi:hypothetical protein